MTKMRRCIFAIFVLIASTGWAQLEQQAYVKASNSGENARFGWDVALDGDTLVVGAPWERSSATGINGDQSDTSLWDAGAVYVFTRRGEVWEQQAYIKASNTDANDSFGYSVDIFGDTLVVGAPRESSSAAGVNGDQHDNRLLYAGAAYVFVREGDQWRQQAYLKASNPGNPDRFGYSVAVHEETIVIGASHEASNARGINGNQLDNSSRNAGAAYIFTRTGENWMQEAYLKASNTDSMNYDYAQDFFGFSVDIYEDTIVVGAHGEDSAAIGIDGDQEDESAGFSGAVYVFAKAEGEWNQQAYIKASNTDAGDEFGYAVSIHGHRIVVGAEYEDSSDEGVDADQTDNLLNNSGAAYVYSRSGNSWVQVAYLKASNPDSWDRFGSSVSIYGNALVIGAWGESSIATGINGNQQDNSAHQAGAAYLFRQDGENWYQDAYIKASNTWLDLFGDSVAIFGDSLVVGADLEASDANGINGDQSDNSARSAGAAYVFVDPSLNNLSPINAGHAGAWFWPTTSGQGQLLDVDSENNHIFIGWFTYTEAESDKPNQQQWFTAQGSYTGNSAVLELNETLGGRFDDPQEVTTMKVGTAALEFHDCVSGTLSYKFDDGGPEGSFPMYRVIPGSENLCENLDESSTQAVDINNGMDGAWYDPATSGQGFFFDVHTDAEGEKFIFVSWFTYGDTTDSGQRWLTAQGPFDGSKAEIDISETTGGSFDDPKSVETTNVGTMTIDFTDCNTAELDYTLNEDNVSGTIDITRAIPDSQALCEELTGVD